VSERQTYSVYVGHIRDAIEHAISFVAGMTFEDFSADERTSYATVRALGIVDEATKRLPPEVRALDPTVPWSDMARLRDRIIHAYDQVDLAAVWATVHDDLPPLRSRLQSLQRRLEQQEDEEWERG
jgi:uncharacterized protein with HEPN domain